MRVLMAICLFALGAHASTVGFVTPMGNVGRSGIVRNDGTVDQFGHDLAHDILYFSPSGAVTRSGQNLQFTSDLQIANPRSKRSFPPISRDALIGDSGIVDPSGKNVQFTPEQVNSIILKGPSGMVLSNGQNIQFTRRRRSLADFGVTAESVVGAAGIVQPDGQNIQLTREQAESLYHVVKGPSGIVTADGKNIQFTAAQAENPNHIVTGPSGVVTADGKNIQFDRRRRSTGYVSDAGSLGLSGVVRKDGTIELFTPEMTHNIVSIGPGGIVMKDGKNVQLTSDLHFARKKRHLVGSSGAILDDGTPIQFKTPGTTIILDGPGGVVFSDGQLHQKNP